MPTRGRSRRMAHRQAELGQRKKRRDSDLQASRPASAALDATHAPENTSSLTAEPAAPTPRPVVAAPPSSLPRQAEPRPAIYNYVRPELKRILTLGSVVFGILIALSFVLR